MNSGCTRASRGRLWLRLGLLAFVFAAGLSFLGEAADHRDGPIFPNSAAAGTHDINDVFVFRSPGAVNNTVLIMNLQPFPGVLTPVTFDPAAYFDIKIASRDLVNVSDDVTFRFTFSTPNAQTGAQAVILRGLPASKFPGTGGILAKGMTGQNIPIRGGGMFRAAIHDDPFYFDAKAGDGILLGGPGPGVVFPRPQPANPAAPLPNEAHNFYGPNVNTLSLILEVPSAVLTRQANGLIGVWGRIEAGGVQLDRAGRPSINTFLIPPVPRNDLTRGERRNAFNAGHPRFDRANFGADMVSVLMSPKFVYKRSLADANTLTGLLLPDILVFQIGNANGFGTFIGPGGSVLGNGRRLTDPVVHTALNMLSNGVFTTDNVGDDNGLRITDGSIDPVSGQVRPIAFPYIGPANVPFNGPGTGPNP